MTLAFIQIPVSLFLSEGFPPVPPWITTLLVGAASAIAGYWWKNWTESRQRLKNERATIVGGLQDLQSLLDASHQLVLIQQDKAFELIGMLKQTHSGECAVSGGLEAIMTRCYPLFSEDEKELHGLIRSYTEHSMRRLNEAIHNWIEQDKRFKTAQIASARRQQLAARLRELEMHLLLWRAKFEYWIPAQPHHALVYMADEKAHGLGFPSTRKETVNGVEETIDGVDDEVARVLIELRKKWK